jgi:hypothetical protein
MWPEGAHLVFRYSEVVIAEPLELMGCALSSQLAGL